ncbi:MAG: thiamine pyrophosphate-dependent enzyme [Anaerolineales bacterium]
MTDSWRPPDVSTEGAEQLAGQRVLSGAEALAWGVTAAQVGLMTGYPGSPATSVYDAVVARGDASCRACWAPNEKVALEMAIGASLGGTRSLVVLKSVGLNVALDPLATVSYSGCHAGLVILLGDDPGGWGSQNEQDSRWLALAAEVPLVEPIEVASAASFMVQAFAWSEAIGLPVIVRVTASLLSRRETVLAPWEPPASHKRFAYKENRWVVLPATVVPRRRALHRKLRQMSRSLEASPYDRATVNTPRGVIAVGAAYPKLGAVLSDPDAYSVLGLASVHPLPEEALKLWLRHCQQVLVLEEGGPFVEQALRALVERLRLSVHILGRQNGVVPEEGELSAGDIEAALRLLAPEQQGTGASALRRELPSAAQLCEGCLYAPLFAALSSAVGRAGGRRHFLLVGETGCMVRAHEVEGLALDVKLSLGASLGLAMGLASTQDRQRVVALVGDSCLFHSEINGLPLAVELGLDLTVIILNNGVTGLTGGQPYPGAMAGGTSQRIVAVCAACGATPVAVAATEADALNDALTAALAEPGLQVVVVDAPCVRYRR